MVLRFTKESELQPRMIYFIVFSTLTSKCLKGTSEEEVSRLTQLNDIQMKENIEVGAF
jgi:hypothetical protein